MKKTILATMLMALSLGTANATNWGNSNGPTNNNTTNTANSSATGVGIGTGGNSSATGGTAYGGSSNATGGSVVGSGNSSNYNGNSNKQGQAQGQMQGQSTENAINSSQSVNVEGDEYDIPVASAYAPSVQPTAVCMGSSMGGVQIAGFGGSLGSSWSDENCMALEQIRMTSSLLKDISTAEMMMCVQFPLYAKGRALTPRPCPDFEAILVENKKTHAPKPIWDKK